MAPSERGRATGATPDDENNSDAHQGTPTPADLATGCRGCGARTEPERITACGPLALAEYRCPCGRSWCQYWTDDDDPPPPNCLDLGNGEVCCVGDAAGMRAAVEWLRRNYPDGVQGERYGPITGPVLNMGASNAIAAYTLYAGKLPPKAMHLLNWMALVSLDRDAEPWWSQGHEVLARMPLGRPEPISAADLRAVERAITPLFEQGAITVDRHSSGRPGHAQHVRYRLWLRYPAPDENRRVDHRTASVEKRRVPSVWKGADIAPPQNLHPAESALPDENCRVPDAGTRRKVAEHPTKSDGTPDENRRAKEYEEYEEREEKQEDIVLSTDSVPVRAREEADGSGNFDQSATSETGGAAAPLSEPAEPAASDATATAVPAADSVRSRLATVAGSRWKSPQDLAAEQVAEARANRDAAALAEANL